MMALTLVVSDSWHLTEDISILNGIRVEAEAVIDGFVLKLRLIVAQSDLFSVGLASTRASFGISTTLPFQILQSLAGTIGSQLRGARYAEMSCSAITFSVKS